MFSVTVNLRAQQVMEEEQKIVDVVVEDNKRVADTRVLSAAQINVGDSYSVLNIRRALINLWATGLYSDINIMAEELPGGLRIIIRVKESPIISKLVITGNKKLKEDEIKQEISLRVGGLYSPSKVQETVNKVIELYQKEGHYNTRIEPAVEDAKVEGRIEITLKINEGRKVKITKIEFEGNEYFSDKKLRGALSTKAKSYLIFWRTGGYDEEKFQKDLTDKLPEFYRKHGFVNVQVLGHDMEFKEDSRDVTIRISVDEGHRFYVGDIKVTGNAHFPDDAVIGSFTLQKNSVFNEEKFEESMQKVRELYGDEGYIYLQAQPLREFEDSLININLVIQEGEPATVRKIIISGNESTLENVIRRRINIYPGDLFRQPLVKMSYQSLVNSGFFEQDIGIEPRPVAEGGEVDLYFKVKEKRTGNANFGAGFGGGYGVTGFLDLTQSNLFGRGKSVQLRLEFGTRVNNIDLNYRDPYFRETPVSLDVGIFHMRRKLRNDPFEDRYKGFFNRWGFPIPGVDYTRFYLGYSLTSIDIRGDSSLVRMYTGANINDYPQTSSKVSFTLARDTRINLQHPQSGTRHSFTAEFSGGPFGGNIGYQKYEYDTAWHIPTYKDIFILGLKVRGGALKPFGGSKSPIVDPRELYILGGTGYGRDTDIHLRGYEDRSVGVDGRYYARGRTFFVITAEQEIKISKQVHGVLFAEAGNVWHNIGDMNLSKLRRSAGFGVRLETPMGPLGLEIGYGFDQTDRLGNKIKGKWVPHFRFGRF
ncbi:MAG: outer membrane protein assembly factor BamA [Gemmatimonadota bacterium]|nr:outer membrane protein assembly factor BamA [Gemmatimonadota bacterium]